MKEFLKIETADYIITNNINMDEYEQVDSHQRSYA